jgi:hypothetical protein
VTRYGNCSATKAIGEINRGKNLKTKKLGKKLKNLDSQDFLAKIFGVLRRAWQKPSRRPSSLGRFGQIADRSQHAQAPAAPELAWTFQGATSRGLPPSSL